MTPATEHKNFFVADHHRRWLGAVVVTGMATTGTDKPFWFRASQARQGQQFGRIGTTHYFATADERDLAVREQLAVMQCEVEQKFGKPHQPARAEEARA